MCEWLEASGYVVVIFGLCVCGVIHPAVVLHFVQYTMAWDRVFFVNLIIQLREIHNAASTEAL
jgi:hypothetical protein